VSAPERGASPARRAETPVAAVPVSPVGPEGIRLRAKLPKVMRLSPKALAILVSISCLAIGGALWWGLRTTPPEAAENVYESENANRSELVTGGPADYSKAPKIDELRLGDAGGPDLAAPQNGETVPLPLSGPPVDPGIAAAEQARSRAAQEREAARASRLFLGGGVAAENPLSDEPPSPPSAAPAAAGPPNRRRAFLSRSSARAVESTARVVEVASPNIVQAGSVIPAALITGIRSDLPGQITAQVTQNVYDSPTGRILLIPQGARLIGEYDSEIIAGQSRVLLAWDRLILPGGRSISLDRLPGADAAGMAGLADRTNYHWGHMLKAALISTLLGVGADLGDNSEDRVIRALRSGGQETVNETGRQIVERQLGIPPTLTIHPGFTLRVIVTRDIIFDPAPQEASI
jgi:type IV secretory pathway VirB10-like protein